MTAPTLPTLSDNELKVVKKWHRILEKLGEVPDSTLVRWDESRQILACLDPDFFPDTWLTEWRLNVRTLRAEFREFQHNSAGCSISGCTRRHCGKYPHKVKDAPQWNSLSFPNVLEHLDVVEKWVGATREELAI